MIVPYRHRYKILSLCAAVLVVFTTGYGCTPPPSDTDWTEVGRDHKAQHFSSLTQITDDNVDELGLAWHMEFPALDGSVANPLVADGVLYVSSNRSRVWAYDLKSGKQLWEFIPDLADRMQPVPSQAHRGITMAGDKIFVGTIDCRLIALDRQTGNPVWQIPACDTQDRIAITAAPRVGGGKVFIGNTVGEATVTRPYIDAYDQETGKRLWRFYTSPPKSGQPLENMAMEMAAPTWDQTLLKDQYGGGSVWGDITYDPVLNQIVFGTQNPQPEPAVERGKNRGDELFTASIVALDADTGAYKWHFKQTPDGSWGYDSTNPITIAELTINNEKRRVLLHSPKSGFFYVLDAETGQFISGEKILPVNWASGLDPATGRPIQNPDARYDLTPGKTVMVNPGPTGTRGWQTMSYSPQTRLAYLPTFDARATYTYHGQGGGTSVDFDIASHDPDARGNLGWLIAWDPVTQNEAWRISYPQKMNGGLLSTAGNLVFQGTANGDFVAYAADSGKKLWSQPTGSSIQAAATTVMVDGTQYVIVNTGATASVLGNMFQRWSFGPDAFGAPQLLVYKLGGTAALPPDALTPALIDEFEQPELPKADPELVRHGEQLFYYCVTCHGMRAEHWTGSIPDLRRSATVQTPYFKDILEGNPRPAGMNLFTDKFSDEDIKALQAYILSRSWQAYEAQQTKP